MLRNVNRPCYGESPRAAERIEKMAKVRPEIQKYKTYLEQLGIKYPTVKKP